MSRNLYDRDPAQTFEEYVSGYAGCVPVQLNDIMHASAYDLYDDGIVHGFFAGIDFAMAVTGGLPVYEKTPEDLDSPGVRKY